MDNRMGSIVMGFIVILIGVVLFQALADEIEATSLIKERINESITVSSTDNIATNESITISSATGNTDNISIINVTFFGNGTINSVTGIHLGTDVNWTIHGEIIVNTDNQEVSTSTVSCKHNH